MPETTARLTRPATTAAVAITSAMVGYAAHKPAPPIQLQPTPAAMAAAMQDAGTRAQLTEELVKLAKSQPEPAMSVTMPEDPAEELARMRASRDRMQKSMVRMMERLAKLEANIAERDALSDPEAAPPATTDPGD